MKKLFYLITILFFSAISAYAQIVTTSPALLQENSQNVTVFFHADQGNKGMIGLSSTTEVYAHTGVDVINRNGGSSFWKYAPDWNQNLPKYKMEYVSANLWKLNIGNIRSFP